MFRPFSWVIFRRTRILVQVLELRHRSIWVHIVFLWIFILTDIFLILILMYYVIVVSSRYCLLPSEDGYLLTQTCKENLMYYVIVVSSRCCLLPSEDGYLLTETCKAIYI
jgi:hypothetical protein